MFQNLNPLDKPTAILEITIMLMVAAILGFLIGYVIHKLQKDKLKSELRFNADRYNTLNKRHSETIQEHRETENIINDLRNRKSNLLSELDDKKKENYDLKNEIQNLINNKGNDTEVKSLNAYIARLKKDKEDLKNKIEETIDTSKNESEIEALNKKIDQLIKENESLKAEIEEANENKSDNGDVNALNAYIARLKKDKEDLKNKLNDKDNTSNTKEIEALNNTIKQLTKSNEILKEDLKKATEINTNLTNTVVAETNIERETSKPAVKTKKDGKPLSIEAFKIKKLALFQSIGEVSENEKDSLTEINGIGPLIEAKLNTVGIYTFSQIANLTDKDVANVTDLIEFFPGRIERDQWVNQAKELLRENA